MGSVAARQAYTVADGSAPAGSKPMSKRTAGSGKPKKQTGPARTVSTTATSASARDWGAGFGLLMHELDPTMRREIATVAARLVETVRTAPRKDALAQMRDAASKQPRR
jgi:hypothetical protein